jgi:non-heme chloroperoxidase
MPYFHALDGARLFYSVWGSGRPIVFIHGGNAGADFWEFQVPALAEKGFQCIVYDQRGFGKSDCPKAGYEVDTLASDLDRLIHHVPVSPCTVVTYSFGACVLARYLSRYGTDKVDKAILVAAITPFFLRAGNNPEGLERNTAYEPFRLGMQNDRAQLFRMSLDAFFCPSTSEHPVSEGVKESMMRIALGSPLMPMLELFRTMSATDCRNDMQAFTIPTLIIHGDCDVFAPPACTGARTHALISGSKLLMYRGASHGLFFTHHGRLNADIAAFMTTIDGTERDRAKGHLNETVPGCGALDAAPAIAYSAKGPNQ